MSRDAVRRPALALLPLVALVSLPAVLTGNQNLSLATSAVIYGTVAAGLGLMYGRLGVLSMSHAALWGIGGYVGVLAMREFGWSFWAVVPLVLVATALAGTLTAIPAFRLKGHHLLITGFILTQLAVVVESQASFTGGPEGLLVPETSGPVLGVEFGTPTGFYYLCVAWLVLAVLLTAVIVRRPIGRRFVAVRENDLLAQSLGIDTRRELIVGFTLSGLYAGIGGLLFAVNLRHIEPSLFGLNAAVLLPLIVMIGGARSFWGPAVGAFIVVFLPEVIDLSPTQVQAVNGALLIAIILLMPEGVLGGLGRVLDRLAPSRGRPVRAPEPSEGRSA